MMSGRKNIKNSIGWSFDNTYSRLPETLLTRIPPTPVKYPKLIILNHELSDELGLNFSNIENASL